MKNISSYSSIRVKKSYVFPIYKEFSKIDNFKTSRDFLYITSNQSYKNNLELIEAWRTSSISSILCSARVITLLATGLSFDRCIEE